MAGCTGRRDASLLVVRIGRAVVILHVARGTVRVGQIEVSVDVALRTLQSGVRSSQRESHQAVIKTGRLPGAGAVASLASLREIQTHMVRVGRFAEIRQVTPDAIRGRAFEFPSDVTSRALQRGMHPSQRKPCVFQMVKVHPKPVIHVVALFARSRKIRLHVAGPGGLLVVGCMAGIALRCQSLVLPSRCALVAGAAI